jgi:hypothetical protein
MRSILRNHSFFGWLIPISLSFVLLALLGHKSSDPQLFFRYSYRFFLLLLGMGLWILTSWRIILDDARYHRFLNRVRHLSIFRFVIVAASILGILTILDFSCGHVITRGMRITAFSPLIPMIPMVLMFIMWMLSTKNPRELANRLSPLIISALIILSLTLAEVILRIKGGEPWQISPVDIIVEPGGTFTRKHATLGYTHLPGVFTVTLCRTSYSFTVTHLRNTLRVTHPISSYERDSSKKEIWIFGGSFTHGWSVNDEETFPWLVQEKFPNYEIVNFGVSGYGTIHSLIQLQEALRKKNKPELAVLTYASFHDRRNIFSRSRRKEIAPWNKLGPLSHPYARIDRQGTLRFCASKMSYIEFPLMRYSTLMHQVENLYNEMEEYYFHGHEVSKVLIKEFSQVCARNGIKLVVAGIISDPLTLDMLEYCKREGILAVDISIELNHKTLNYPHDGHPSPLGQKKYAQKVISFLKTMLGS